MTDVNCRFVFQAEGGLWRNQRQGASSPGSVHASRDEALSSARRLLEFAGGGELLIYTSEGELEATEVVRSRKALLEETETPRNAGLRDSLQRIWQRFGGAPMTGATEETGASGTESRRSRDESWRAPVGALQPGKLES